ncbi:CRISPR-associated endonuclease Cas1 [candidate division KSB1 bacterium]|nr:CRISPR-associated endonuclease Cas1 [candidate division KSB1 bacterium]
MATLYLTEPGAVLHKSSDLFIVQKRKDTLLEVPCAEVEHVMLYGNIQVTTAAQRKLAEHGIPLVHFTQNGRLLFRLTPPWPKNSILREKQWRRHFDPEFALRLSRSLVAGKLENALAVIRDYRHNHPELKCETELDTIVAARAQVEGAAMLDSLRGLEGAAAAAYFKVLGRMFFSPWQFAGRNRRPPRDPVNAVLSFGYVIVANELQSLLEGLGFDPYAGFFHATEYGRPSLALDLLEEFRHTLVDRLALHLFNQNIFAEGDFEKTANAGVYLNRDGQKKFFRSYERYLGLHRYEPPEGAVGYFRQHFKFQAYKLAKAIQDDGDYEPFRLHQGELGENPITPLSLDFPSAPQNDDE